MRLCVLAVLAACYSPREIDTHCARCKDITTCPSGEPCIEGFCQKAAGQCAEEIDAPPPIDAPAGCFGVEARPFFTMCIPSEVVVPQQITPAAMITTGGAVNDCTYIDPADTARVKPPMCVIVADKIDFGSMHQITGARPIVFIARNELSIGPSAVLDLAGHASDDLASTATPAGANEPLCTANAGGNAVGTSGAGGGAGGSFATQGGAGGANGGGMLVMANPPITSPNLRGGCRGGDGGNNGVSGGGKGGNAGGVIYLLSPLLIVNGQINASGGGGRGVAIAGAGGAGGGSGGMILLWSSQPIMIGGAAKIFALGGGGASGGSQINGAQIGDDPGSPIDPADSTPSGGGPSAGGGTGKPGTQGMPGGATANGGGGGGGGNGYIRAMPAIQPSSQIAPPPS